MYGRDFLTGEYGLVEKHHIFGGALRKKSERFKLFVYLLPENHREGANAAHRSRETAEDLKRYGQEKYMIEQGATVEDFIREFGQNYLDTEAVERIREAVLARAEEERKNAFRVIDSLEELPF